MILPGNPTRRRAEEAHLVHARLKALEAGIDRMVEVAAKAAAFSPAEIDEVGKLLVEGRIRLPCYTRLTVITEVEEVKSKIFGTSEIFTHTADQLHVHRLRPFTVLEALEAGLIRRIPNGWVWSTATYERLAAAQ
jgi:hypothetical protein